MTRCERQICRSFIVFAVFVLVCSTVSFLPLRSFQVMAAVTAPPMDAEARFIVYPDGTVELAGKCNLTDMFPISAPTIHMDETIQKSNGVYEASMNGVVKLPPEQALQFPFNATSVSVAAECSEDLAEIGANASLILPDRLTSGGMSADLSGFPFDSADFTLDGEYSGQSFNGTITVHLIPGLSLGDVHLNFRGNLTEITIDDSVEVFYNYTLPIPGFPDINEIYISQMLQRLADTIRGKGPGSLYNVTLGAVECTTFNATIVPVDENNAEIFFLVILQGDFIQLLTNSLISQTPTVGSMPFGPMLGNLSLSAFNSTFYSLLNATCYSTDNARVTLGYSRESRRFDLQTDVTVNLTQSRNATAMEIPGMNLQQLQPYIESIYNTSLCSLKSCIETISYSGGVFSYSSNYTYEGNLNDEVNFLKNTYINMMSMMPVGGIPPEALQVLKECNVDIEGLSFSEDVDGNLTSVSFENVKVTPPVDSVNATCFRLSRFFNIISSEYEPPFQNGKLRLVVQGGSNGTHSVTPFIDPNDLDKLSYPDEFAGENTLIWNNMSISKLSHLMFKVWEGHAETINTPTSVTEANPVTIDDRQAANCMLSLTNVSKPATICVKNATGLPDITAPPAEYKMLGNYVVIAAEPEDVAVNLTIRIYYTAEQLSTLGLSENDLKIFYWDAGTSSWTAVETHLNNVEHYAWTTVDHLSVWTLLGQPSQMLWEQPWFLVSMLAVIAAIVTVAAILLKRKK
jgi:hypothetical protein